VTGSIVGSAQTDRSLSVSAMGSGRTGVYLEAVKEYNALRRDEIFSDPSCFY
jgi:hypothetical protein